MQLQAPAGRQFKGPRVMWRVSVAILGLVGAGGTAIAAGPSGADTQNILAAPNSATKVIRVISRRARNVTFRPQRPTKRCGSCNARTPNTACASIRTWRPRWSGSISRRMTCVALEATPPQLV